MRAIAQLSRYFWTFGFLSVCLCAEAISDTAAAPFVVAHRAASGYLPEHTLPAVVLAYMQGADYIEQDLVLSKDGKLVVLHDIVLQATTNVAEVFPARARSDGEFYAIDFTLQELKQLRAFSRHTSGVPKGESTDTDTHAEPHAVRQLIYPQRYAGTDGFQISTWDEQVTLIRELNRQFGRNVGWFPELKAPAWHAQQGQDILKVYVDALASAGLNQRQAKVITQCFDWLATQALVKDYGLNTAIVQLIGENSWAESSTDYDVLQSPAGIAAMAQVVDGVGPWLPQLYDRELGQPSAFWQALQSFKQTSPEASSLVIIPYTHRDDALILADSAQAQLGIIFDQLNADGLFTDHVDTVRQYVQGHTTFMPQ